MATDVESSRRNLLKYHYCIPSPKQHANVMQRTNPLVKDEQGDARNLMRGAHAATRDSDCDIHIYIYIYSFTFKSRCVSDLWQQYFLHGVAGPTAYDGCVATLEFQNEVADILYKISSVPCSYDRTQQKVIC